MFASASFLPLGGEAVLSEDVENFDIFVKLTEAVMSVAKESHVWMLRDSWRF